MRSGKTKKAERREQLRLWAWEAWNTWARVLESRAQAWGTCQPFFPQRWTAVHPFTCPCVHLPPLLTHRLNGRESE